MDKHNKNSFQYQIKTFRYAFNGLQWFFSSEIKSRIHSLCAIAAIVLGIVLKISRSEWMMVVLAIGLVFIVEILNTGIELIVDRLEKEHNETAGRIKDLAAGAVLIAAITALIVGLMVFLPRLVECISKII